MVTFGCKCNSKGLDRILDKIKKEVVSVEREVGEKAVEYARQNGNYRDRTGHLRASNKFKADESGLTVFNDADYASEVEAKGYEVVSSAALYAEELLKEKCRP